MSGIIINPYSFATGSAFSTKSLDFDGIDDYVSTSIQNATLSTQTWSASVWVNWSALSGNNEAVLSTRQNGIGTSKGIDLYMTGNTILRARVYVGNGGYADITTTIPAIDTWYHAVITFASNTLKLYFDGVLIGSSTSVYTPSTNPLFIGKWGNGNEFHSGLIDEVGIFDIELTQTNVTEIYNSGTPTDLSLLTTPPTNWFRMGENSTFSSPQILMPEQSNKDKVSNFSMDFDGLDDKILFDSIALGTDYTISAWAKRDSTANMFLLGNEKTYGYGAYFNGTAALYFKETALVTFNNAAVQTALARTDWVNWVFKKDSGAGTMAVYVDGVLAESVTTANGMSTITAIGASGLPTGTQYVWDGNIDEVSIYNTSSIDLADIGSATTPKDLSAISGLTHWWRMGEEAIFNSTNWLLPNKAQDVFSRYSMDFDGVGDHINCGTSIGTSLGDGYTGPLVVSLWFKADTTSGDDGLFTFNSTPSYGELSAALKANYLDVFVAGSSELHHSFTDTTDWHNLVINLDGSATSTNQVYLDGVAVGSTFGPYTALDLDALGFFIGYYWSNAYPFQGKIDEVAIFNTAKAIGDIWDGSGKPTDLTGQSGLVSWWRMGEDATFSTNWTVPDQIGSNNGTSANMTNDDLTGDAPGVTGNGVSANMTIEDRTGDAPDSSNNP